MAGYTRQDSPVVERSDMEKGIAKTRRTASDAIVQISVKLFFRTLAIEVAFDDWYYSPTGANAGAAWFDWTDPRTKTVRQARMVSRGTHTPVSRDFGYSEQPCVLEYVRSAAA